MTQSEYTTRVIQAESGKYLTQVADVALQNRIVTNDKVYLAVTDSPENWCEISAEEAEAILAEQKALAEKEENNPENAENTEIE